MNARQSNQMASKQDDPRLVIVLFSLLAVLPFITVIDGPFLFDDEALIVQNPVVHSLGQGYSWLTKEFWHLGQEGVGAMARGVYFRPLVLLSYALDWTLGGGSSWVFHVTNLLLCACASALIMSVLLRWCRGESKTALLAGCLFALHPSKAESAAWIAGRTDLLLALGCGFALLGLSYSLGWGVHGEVRPRRVLGGVLLVLGSCIAFASKELALILPALIMSHLMLFESQSRGDTSVGRMLSRHKLSLGFAGLSSLSYILLRVIWLPFAELPVSLNLMERGLLFLDSCGRYLRLLLVPSDLSLFAAYKPLALVELRDAVSWLDVGLGLVHCAAFAGWAWFAIRRQNMRLTALLLSYGACLLPMSNLVPMATDISVSPRFLYLPLLPWGCLVAQALVSKWPRAQQATLGVVLLLGLLLCLMRGRDFASAEAFWRYELAHNPAVPSVLGANAEVDEDLHQPLLAAARRACTYALAQSQGDVVGMSRMLSTFVHGATRATPHAATSELRILAAWTDDLLRLAPRPITWANVSLEMQAAPPQLAALELVQASLRLERVHQVVRSGDGEPLAQARLAIGLCPGCPDIAYRAARMALLVHDVTSAGAYLEQAGLDKEPIVAGLPVGQVSERLAQLDVRASQGDPGAALERQLLVDNHDRVVDLVKVHPDWSTRVSVEVRLRVAKSASMVGDWAVVAAWLQGLASEQELQSIRDELMRTSPAYNARKEVLLPWVKGSCARAHELR